MAHAQGLILGPQENTSDNLVMWAKQGNHGIYSALGLTQTDNSDVVQRYQ